MGNMILEMLALTILPAIISLLMQCLVRIGLFQKRRFGAIWFSLLVGAVISVFHCLGLFETFNEALGCSGLLGLVVGFYSPETASKGN